MPLDGNMGYDFKKSFLNRASWQLKFAWLPRRCVFSKKIIWLERAQCGTSVWTGPGTDVVETHWSKDLEFIIWNLKH